MPSNTSVSYGQVIEYIQDRVYLASYTHPPSEHTPFPYPTKPSKSPTKRSSRAQNGPTAASTTRPKVPAYFTIDNTLLYNAFHADFGPLHVGHLYRFAVLLHEVLADPANVDRPVVFWSNDDSRSRANAACILACYMVMIQSWPPHLALAPISQMDPPCMPFRDAGYSQADYVLNVQDIVYGVWKAKEENLVGLREFNLEEYERFERVDMGDFNWVTPDFLAFASPQCTPVAPVAQSDPRWAKIPSTRSGVAAARDIPLPFKNVLMHFSERNIGLVVRLNSELYCPTYFTKLGIQHLDMIFDDGTCPGLKMVRQFINLAHEVITVRKRGIAVHCKAGLGRTGCLIGAYLIYRHGFTANEIIAFMRFMRPGMVVGPQQHWLHLNQGTFREWWFEDTVLKPKLAAISTLSAPATPSKSSPRRLVSTSQSYTPPHNKREALGEITSNGERPDSRVSSGSFHTSTSTSTIERSTHTTTVPPTNPTTCGVSTENLPAPTPGQPRKTSKRYGPGVSSPLRNLSSRLSSPHTVDYIHEDDPHALPAVSDTEGADDVDVDVVMMSSYRDAPSGETEEEIQLRMLARRHASRSPTSSTRKSAAAAARRAVSHSSGIGGNAAALLEELGMGDGEVGIENRPIGQETKARKVSGGYAKMDNRAPQSARKSADGVRKVSGRVGSMGSIAVGGRK
ncbi:phosphatases II [Eremomyces bilateralis CBS 781.70]|uniref:protein-tyrosine-phosphatase n=1 Tax=Eremomyces bilateralis CBS 781.70 TaxID=1392243 RepID=A0A6G1GAT3_9PEZI|nr:phosphatases II [Eremomyces bilateralis CBS 781.70]KAF1814959.1 phosphatases II [Eremomyces bilateralis CBS 781.70]